MKAPKNADSSHPEQSTDLLIRWYWRCDLCDASGFFDLPVSPGVGREVLEAQLAHELRVPACVSTAQRAEIGRMPPPAIVAGWA